MAAGCSYTSHLPAHAVALRRIAVLIEVQGAPVVRLVYWDALRSGGGRIIITITICIIIIIIFITIFIMITIITIMDKRA